MKGSGERLTRTAKSKSPDDPFSECRQASAEPGTARLLNRHGFRRDDGGRSLFGLLVLFARLGGGRSGGSVFGASAANIIGTATAAARKVIAVFRILFLLRRLLLSAFYTSIMRLNRKSFDSPERLWEGAGSRGAASESYCGRAGDSGEAERRFRKIDSAVIPSGRTFAPPPTVLRLTTESSPRSPRTPRRTRFLPIPSTVRRLFGSREWR